MSTSKRPRQTGSSSRSRANPRGAADAANALGIHFTSDEQRQQFLKNKDRAFMPTRYLDFGMLATLGIAEDIEWLAARLGWQAFIHFEQPTYRDLTLEFLSSLDCELIQGSRRDVGLCTFRLGNVDRELTLAEVSEIFGFPPARAGTPRIEARAHFCSYPAFWQEIAASQLYDPAKTKASWITNPAIRLLHRFMAHTIFGRGDGGENSASKKEVLLLCAALYNQEIDSAAFLMGHLRLVGHKVSGTIACGGLVTALAQHFRIPLAGRRDYQPSCAIDFSSLINMRMVVQRSSSWYWVLPTAEGEKRLLRLPNPARTSLQLQANWNVRPLPSDPHPSSGKQARARLATPMEEQEDEEEEDDDDAEADESGPAASGSESYDPRLYSMLETMQRDMADGFSTINARIDNLRDDFHSWRFPGPPPSGE